MRLISRNLNLLLIPIWFLWISSKNYSVNNKNCLFTLNCYIKLKLAKIIIDNGSQKNLISWHLVEEIQCPTLAHPNPYNIGWFKEARHSTPVWLIDVLLLLLLNHQWILWIVTPCQLIVVTYLILGKLTSMIRTHFIMVLKRSQDIQRWQCIQIDFLC